MATSQLSRSIVKTVLARETSEGAGAIVRRSIGTPQLRNFTPFLMLDHFNVAEGAGFPDHPHRGMSTVTYMLEGSFEHEDFMGNRGLINAGDSQWMTAASGIVHAEMPVHKPGLPNPTGLQLWVDIPKARKMDKPSYTEVKAETFPTAHPTENTIIKVLSGTSVGNSSEGDVTSPVQPPGGVWIFDVKFTRKDDEVFQKIPPGWNAFFYTLKGQVLVGDSNEVIDQYYTTVLSSNNNEEGIKLKSVTDESQVFLVAGEPLDQEIVQHGPFVMDTKEKIQQAFFDYQAGKNGFEKARGWQSEIGASMR